MLRWRLPSKYSVFPWIPVAATLSWLGCLISLLLLWLIRDNGQRYRRSEGSVVFISNAGAIYKTLFVTLCTCTAVLYVASLLSVTYLRKLNRLPGPTRKSDLILECLALFFGIVGGIFLVLLSAFDAFQYGPYHWGCAIAFIVSVAFSATFQTIQIFRLSRIHIERRHLRRNALIKLVVAVLAIGLAIAFLVTYLVCDGNRRNSFGNCLIITTTSATLEWAIAFLCAIYLFTLVLDIFPATRYAYERKQRHLEERKASEAYKRLSGASISSIASSTSSSSSNGIIDLAAAKEAVAV